MKKDLYLISISVKCKFWKISDEIVKTEDLKSNKDDFLKKLNKKFLSFDLKDILLYRIYLIIICVKCMNCRI